MVHVVGIVGMPGSGKTCLAVYLAYLEKQRGRRVLSNIRLKFTRHADGRPGWEPLRFPTAEPGRSKAAWPDLHEAVILWDEAHAFGGDSRLSMRPVNRAITWFVTQTRKRNVDLVYTTQALRQVDVRIRTLTTVVIQCEARGDTTVGWLHRRDLQGDLRRDRHPIALYRPSVYSMYDTYEVVSEPGT